MVWDRLGRIPGGGGKVESWEWLLMTAALIVSVGLILILGVIDE